MFSISQIADRYRWPDNGRPWLRTNFVTTIDGAAQDASGLSGDLGGEEDFRIFHVLRSTCDVIVAGAGTTRAEGYEPVRPDEVHAELRTDRATQVPPIAIVSESLNIPEPLTTGGQILITHLGTDRRKREKLAETMDVIAVGDNEIDWAAVLAAFADRQLFRVLCEGGPELHGSLLEADVVDELCVTLAHVTVGGAAKRIATGEKEISRAMRLADRIDGEEITAFRWVRDRDGH